MSFRINKYNIVEILNMLSVKDKIKLFKSIYNKTNVKDKQVITKLSLSNSNNNKNRNKLEKIVHDYYKNINLNLFYFLLDYYNQVLSLYKLFELIYFLFINNNRSDIEQDELVKTIFILLLHINDSFIINTNKDNDTNTIELRSSEIYRNIFYLNARYHIPSNNSSPFIYHNSALFSYLVEYFRNNKNQNFILYDIFYNKNMRLLLKDDINLFKKMNKKDITSEYPFYKVDSDNNNLRSSFTSYLQEVLSSINIIKANSSSDINVNYDKNQNNDYDYCGIMEISILNRHILILCENTQMMVLQNSHHNNYFLTKTYFVGYLLIICLADDNDKSLDNYTLENINYIDKNKLDIKKEFEIFKEIKLIANKILNTLNESSKSHKHDKLSRKKLFDISNIKNKINNYCHNTEEILNDIDIYGKSNKKKDLSKLEQVEYFNNSKLNQELIYYLLLISNYSGNNVIINGKNENNGNIEINENKITEFIYTINAISDKSSFFYIRPRQLVLLFLINNKESLEKLELNFISLEEAKDILENIIFLMVNNILSQLKQLNLYFPSSIYGIREGDINNFIHLIKAIEDINPLIIVKIDGERNKKVSVDPDQNFIKQCSSKLIDLNNISVLNLHSNYSQILSSIKEFNNSSISYIMDNNVDNKDIKSLYPNLNEITIAYGTFPSFNIELKQIDIDSLFTKIIDKVKYTNLIMIYKDYKSQAKISFYLIANISKSKLDKKIFIEFRNICVNHKDVIDNIVKLIPEISEDEGFNTEMIKIYEHLKRSLFEDNKVNKDKCCNIKDNEPRNKIINVIIYKSLIVNLLNKSNIDFLDIMNSELITKMSISLSNLSVGMKNTKLSLVDDDLKIKNTFSDFLIDLTHDDIYIFYFILLKVIMCTPFLSKTNTNIKDNENKSFEILTQATVFINYFNFDTSIEENKLDFTKALNDTEYSKSSLNKEIKDLILNSFTLFDSYFSYLSSNTSRLILNFEYSILSKYSEFSANFNLSLIDDDKIAVLNRKLSFYQNIRYLELDNIEFGLNHKSIDLSIITMIKSENSDIKEEYVAKRDKLETVLINTIRYVDRLEKYTYSKNNICNMEFIIFCNNIRNLNLILSNDNIIYVSYILRLVRHSKTEDLNNTIKQDESIENDKDNIDIISDKMSNNQLPSLSKDYKPFKELRFMYIEIIESQIHSNNDKINSLFVKELKAIVDSGLLKSKINSRNQDHDHVDKDDCINKDNKFLLLIKSPLLKDVYYNSFIKEGISKNDLECIFREKGS